MKHPEDRGGRLHESERAKAEARVKLIAWRDDRHNDPKWIGKQASCHSRRCSCHLCRGDKARDTRSANKFVWKEESEF